MSPKPLPKDHFTGELELAPNPLLDKLNAALAGERNLEPGGERWLTCRNREDREQSLQAGVRPRQGLGKVALQAQWKTRAAALAAQVLACLLD